MQIKAFLAKLNSAPDSIEFHDTMAVIEANYSYSPTAFSNGGLFNQAGENEGSCKIFAFARLHHLNQSQTLSCYGTYYRDEVLNNPEDNNHQNIQNFIKTGWDGIKFDNHVLKLK